MGGGVVPTLNAFDNATESRATVLVVYPIQDGREMDKKQNGLGIGKAGDSSYTLDRTGGQSVIIAFSHTQGLDAQPNEKHTPTLRKNGGGQAMTDGEIVRRLTPVECERLQGFPDDWTKYRIDNKKGLIPQADSSRYKQMGNAVAVPCVEWIIDRLVEHEAQQN